MRFARVTQSEKLGQGVPRINNQIKTKEVRLKLDDEQTQVMPTQDAVILAKEKDMDLIETVARASPPVCIIMEFNKFRYEQKKKEKEMKKNMAERTLKDKELQLTYNISPHDLQVKLKKQKELLDMGSKVKIVIKTGRKPQIQPIIDLFVKIHDAHSEDCVFSLLPKSYLNQPVAIYIVQQKALNLAKEKLKSYSRSDIEDHLWKLEKRRQMEDQGFLSTGNPETTPLEKVK